MRQLCLIGIGVGNINYLTLQALEALARVDVVFLVDKGSEVESLASFRKEICARFITKPFRTVEIADPKRDRASGNYEAAVADWHAKRSEAYERAIREQLGENECGAFLVWGDPSLYDSTLRIVDRVAAMKTVAFSVEVIPGISSIQALAARHKISLNDVGKPVAVTTGRQLSKGMIADDVIVMLDGTCAFNAIEDREIEIYWGAYVGSPDEILVAGPLHERGREIEQVRTAARARHGWIMDIYLLRRKPQR